MNLLTTANRKLTEWHTSSNWFHERYLSTEDPIVIGGAGRSGTTLLSVILNAHPDVFCGDEQELLSVGGFSIEDAASTLQLDLDHLYTEARETEGRWEFVEYIIRLAKEEYDSGFFATKYPNYIFGLHTILRTFPSARYIHMCRDGRDVARSMRENESGMGCAPMPSTTTRESSRWTIAQPLGERSSMPIADSRRMPAARSCGTRTSFATRKTRSALFARSSVCRISGPCWTTRQRVLLVDRIRNTKGIRG